MRKLVANIREGDRVAGVAILCKTCRLLFIGRADALFCSDGCRQAAYRGRLGEKDGDAGAGLMGSG
jgi:hypothetical protein